MTFDMNYAEREYLRALRQAAKALTLAADHLEAGRYAEAAVATGDRELLQVVVTLYQAHRLWATSEAQLRILAEAEEAVDAMMAPSKDRPDA